jgi:phosphoribosylformylglycinamidine synthase
MKPKALILHATGTNRDREAAQAFELAGAAAEIVPLNMLRRGEKKWSEYQILALPGGFSYADALGAGRLLALDLMAYFAEEVGQFVEAGKPVIGICNGFQALVKAGILPETRRNGPPSATLTFNASGKFECRWVTLIPTSEKCLWTRGLSELVDCPVAHGEGNFVTAEPTEVCRISNAGQVALVYACPDGTPAGNRYPDNPNGSMGGIAGICNPNGNVLGLMPHPEDHIFPWQHPQRSRGFIGRSGLRIFENGVRAVCA